MATVSTTRVRHPERTGGLPQEVTAVRELERRLAADLQAGTSQLLPGNAAFLEDGRVLCRPRARGDSRYPYGRDGLHLWAHASGYIHGNDGLFFIFLPAQDGQEPSVAFFIGQRRPDGTCLPISVLPVPWLAESEPLIEDRYTVFGHDAVYYLAATSAVSGAVRMFVDQRHAGRIDVAFSLHIENRTAGELELFASAFMNPFCRHQFAATCEDRWFKKIRVVNGVAVGAGGRHLPPLVIAVNEDVSRFQSVTNHAVVRRATSCEHVESEVCTSRLGYVGNPRAGLAQAACLRAGMFACPTGLTVFNDSAVVSDLNRFRLAGGQTARFDYALSLLRPGGALAGIPEQPLASRDVDEALEDVRAERTRAPGALRLRVTGSELAGVSGATLNHFFPFLIEQVRVCAQTRGYMQPSPNSLIGIRDVFQAAEGHLYDQPQAARDKLREALGFVLEDGRCPRQYSLPVNGAPGRSDLREFIDQGAWVVSALHTYLALTGDTTLLAESTGYHEVVDTGGIRPAAQHGTVLEHLIRIMRFLTQNRDPETGLVLSLYGDWNDAVDGLGTTSAPGQRFGTGVSVMASLQFYQNCREMIAILQRFYPGQYLDLLREYQRTAAELEVGLRTYAIVTQGHERRIVHGWGDRRSYYVGSFQDSDGLARDSLTSNAFWVIAGLLRQEPGLRPHILAALRRLDSRYGLKTFAPGFAPDAPGVGRVCKLPLGTAENGATYVHATLFGIAALFQMGEPRAAWEQIEKVLPFAPHQTGLSHSPFVMPNSYVFNPELNLTGQSMNDWQTGSSNVLLKLLVRYVFGLQPGLDTLRIQPAAWRPLDGLELDAVVRGRQIRIVQEHGPVVQRNVTLNGAELETIIAEDGQAAATVIPYERLNAARQNTIVVADPPRS